MKMAIIGAVLLVLVLGMLFIITEGAQSTNDEPGMRTDPLLEQNTQPPSNKNFNL